MPEIRDSLFARADGKPLCHRAMPRPANWGKMNHILVALLLAAPQFGKHSRIDWLLRIDETLRTKGIAHSAVLSDRVNARSQVL
jgi:hypothetical protein